MKRICICLCALLLLQHGAIVYLFGEELTFMEVQENLEKGHYPRAFTSLLEEMNRQIDGVNCNLIKVKDFSDPRMFSAPFIYTNFSNLSFPLDDANKESLKEYLLRGGFLWIDAGVAPGFFRTGTRRQGAAFGEADADPQVKQLMEELFPDEKFVVIMRNHPMFKCFPQELDTTELPPVVKREIGRRKNRRCVGVGLYIEGRLAVICTYTMTFSLSRNPDGKWTTPMCLFVEEVMPDLAEPPVTGKMKKYKVRRTDGDYDEVYCLNDFPKWRKEPNGLVSKISTVGNKAISEYLHKRNTLTGLNIIIYALTH